MSGGGARPPLRRARVNGVELAYRLGGEGPPVALVHGSLDDHGMWDGVADRLRSRCTVLAHDRRGHSASTAPPGQGTIDEDAEDVAALVRHLDLGPTVVVGHSHGATVALLVGAHHPELVAGVVVHEPPLYGFVAGDPGWEAFRQRQMAAMAEVAAGMEAGDTEVAVRRFVDDVAFGAGAWDGLYDERARATALANADTWLDQYHDPGRLAIDISPLAEAPFSITVCLGTTNRSALPEIARRVAGSLPSATLVEVQGAGHGAPSSHPAELAEVVMACVAGDQA